MCTATKTGHRYLGGARHWAKSFMCCHLMTASYNPMRDQYSDEETEVHKLGETLTPETKFLTNIL